MVAYLLHCRACFFFMIICLLFAKDYYKCEDFVFSRGQKKIFVANIVYMFFVYDLRLILMLFGGTYEREIIW